MVTEYKGFYFTPHGTIAPLDAPRRQYTYRRLVLRNEFKMSFDMWLIYFNQLRTPAKYKRLCTIAKQ